MKNKLAKLIDVKTIVTLLLSVTFVYLAIQGIIGAELYMTIFTVVIAFYFGTQYQKSKQETTDIHTTACPFITEPETLNEVEQKSEEETPGI